MASTQCTPRTRSAAAGKKKILTRQQLETERPLATLEIVEQATVGVKGLTTQDALRVWKALGSYLETQLTHKRAVKVEHFGIFALNAAWEPIFLHNPVFLQSNRLRESAATKKKHGVVQAIGEQCDPITSASMAVIGTEFLPSYSKEIVSTVITYVVAHVGKLAKQGRVLRLGLLPLGEWYCAGDTVGFTFLQEFQTQMKLRRSVGTAKVGSGEGMATPARTSPTHAKSEQAGAQESVKQAPPSLSAALLRAHATTVSAAMKSSSRSSVAMSKGQGDSIRNPSLVSASKRTSSSRQATGSPRDHQSESVRSRKSRLTGIASASSSAGLKNQNQRPRETRPSTPAAVASTVNATPEAQKPVKSKNCSSTTARRTTRPGGIPLKKGKMQPQVAWRETSPEDVAVVQRVKSKLIQRCGQNGLNSLSQVLHLMDSSGDGELSVKELKFGLRDIGIELAPSELTQVMQAFDRNGDGSIDVSEFVGALRGPALSPARRALVHKAFALMDPGRNGVISLEDLRDNYDVSLFPSVRAKKKSKQQALAEFLRQWEESEDCEHGGRITLDAFVNYYHNISACIADDSDFELLMRQTWHVSPSDEQQDSESDQENQRRTTESPGSAGSSGEQLFSKTRYDTSRHDESFQPRDIETNADSCTEPTVAEDWKYLQALLLPTRAVSYPNSRPASVDDISRKLGANRVWGDGNEVMQGKVFAHALTLLDKQLAPKKALLIAQRVALSVARDKKSGSDGSIGLADLHRWLSSSQPHVSSSTAIRNNDSNTVVDRVRARLLQRIANSNGGNNGVQATTKDAVAVSHVGLNGLQRSLKLIDTNGDKRLSKDELQVGLRRFGVDVTFHELDYLFALFDADRSGCISVDEFLVGMRGEISPRRLVFVSMAFDLLDADHDGSVTLQELASAYDTSKHPDVLSGKLTPHEALALFAAQWESEKEKDGVVTKHEFEEYYKNLSASIDSDDYFELMMRNAWHISGGEGVCANSTNRRVLVTQTDNTQSVEEISNDLGLQSSDYDAVHARLRQQGVAVATRGNNNNPVVELYGAAPETVTRKARCNADVFRAPGVATNSLDPPWQKKQMQPREHAAHQARQPPPGRAFHRRRVLDMVGDDFPVGGDVVDPHAVFARHAADSAGSSMEVVQSNRDRERHARRCAAQLIQSHFRGFKTRKFVDCVRRKLEAEKQRQVQWRLQQQQQHSGRNKVTRPALRAHHGF